MTRDRQPGAGTASPARGTARSGSPAWAAVRKAALLPPTLLVAVLPVSALLITVLLASVLLLTELPGARDAHAQGAYAAAPAQAGPGGKPPVDTASIEGAYSIEELKRLIQLARESGFSEAQIREITVEDEQGNVINAWEFLKAWEERQRREAEARAAIQAKVYLSPKDILRELNDKQPKDLDDLRDRMIFIE